MQVIGKLEEVHDVVKRTETFSVREFVLEISNPSSQFSEHVLFQLTNQRTNLVDQFQVGQEIVVDFDLQGRKWTNPQDGRIVFFNRLNAWRISPYSGQMGGQMGGYGAPQGGFGGQMGGYGAAPQGGYTPQGGYGAPQGGFNGQPAGFGGPQGGAGTSQGGFGGQQAAPAAPQQTVAPQGGQQAPAGNGGDEELPF